MFSRRILFITLPVFITFITYVYYAGLINVSSISRKAAYEAPLLGTDEPKRVRGTYFVWLRLGYSVLEHDKVVGWTPAERIVTVSRDGTGIWHGAQAGNDKHLAAIRVDKGVVQVHCDAEFEFLLPNETNKSVPQELFGQFTAEK
jgi:hypothetical protein